MSSLMVEQEKPQPRSDLEERLRRFRQHRSADSDRPVPAGPSHGGLGLAMRIGVELVAALIVGVGLGYLLDDWLGTMPLFSLLGFFFGAAAGMLNVYRTATGRGSAIGFGRRTGGDR